MKVLHPTQMPAQLPAQLPVWPSLIVFLLEHDYPSGPYMQGAEMLFFGVWWIVSIVCICIEKRVRIEELS